MQLNSNILSNIETGILYQNAKPYLKSIHGYFPSVAAMPNGEVAAIYALAEAFEATNSRIHHAVSKDNGQTWQANGGILPRATDRLVSEVGKMSISPDGELIVNAACHDRTEHPEDGLTNPANMGFVPMEIVITRSGDGGHNWSKPAVIQPPLVGPCFEICSPITFLRNGRWILPTSTWLDWNGNLPNGNRMVAFVSSDRGVTWPTYLDVMHSPDNNLIFWESKILELPDGRLLAVAWCYDQKANADRPNQYAISHDGGATWTPPQSMGLLGQTLTPHLLPDGRVLCVYRRMDRPGLWAVVAHLEGDDWVNEAWHPLWGNNTAGRTSQEDTMVETFQGLKFGAPSMTTLADGSILLAFWCYERNIGIIRWYRFFVVH